MSATTNLDAFHRMAFYKNKQNWKFTRQTEDTDNAIGGYDADEQRAGHIQIDTQNSLKDSGSGMDINQTYDLEEGSPLEQQDGLPEDPDDPLISSGVVEGDVSSVESECVFVSGARLVPHSSTFSLCAPCAPPPTPQEFPELDMMDIHSQLYDDLNVDPHTFLTRAELVQHALREQAAVDMHTQRLQYYLQLCQPRPPPQPLPFPYDNCQLCDQPLGHDFCSSVQSLMSLLEQPSDLASEPSAPDSSRLPPFSDFSLRARGRGRGYFGT